MELRNPEYLFGILIFALLLFLASKRRRGYYFSGQSAVKKIRFGWRILNVLPKLFYLGIVSALLLALAAPFTQQTRTEIVIEGKILVPCLDVSGSMSAKTKDGRTKLEIILNILKEFLESRGEVDVVGLTAFSGGGDGWGGGIIQRPTLSREVFLAASKKIKSEMFGSTTPIGEGIFISIAALNDMDWNKKLQQESGNNDKEFDIQRLWAAVNTLDLPEFGLPNADAKTKDDFIISEAARLAPPEKNKNKVIILFSDGDSNTGLDPIKSMWLAQRFGIKVYYIEVVSEETITAAAGDYGKLPEHRRDLVLAIKRTGGEYFAGQNYADVRNFFMNISKLEKDKITVVNKYDINESYEFFVGIACVLAILLIALEFIMNF